MDSKEYAVDEELVAFFAKTSTTQAECGAKTRQLTSNAGLNLWLLTLALDLDIFRLASRVHGSLVPSVDYHGMLGDHDVRDKEPLCVYLMSRMPGITQLDFILSHEFSQDSPEYSPWRETLTGGIARFFVQSWLSHQIVSPSCHSTLKAQYIHDLELLSDALPVRFRGAVQMCLDSMDDIMELPMVLTHKGFGQCNLLVDKDTCHVKGVIDWAEAEICPFGMNLHSILMVFGSMHLQNGWTRFPDYDDSQELFWSILKEEAVLTDHTVAVIKKARVLGMLLSHGFTSRLHNETQPVPIKDDECGRYQLMYLDGFLVNEKTKLDGIDE